MTKRKVEIFSADCPLCQETIELVNELACSSCEIIIHDLHDEDIQIRAKELGVKFVPAVVINNVLTECSQGKGFDEAILKAGGIGIPL